MDAWASYKFDPRILKALKKMGFTTPTSIQSRVFPSVLGGKDVMAKSATGSGKTYSVVLPTLHKILINGKREIACIYFVPTDELGNQVFHTISNLIVHCEPYASCYHISETASKQERKKKLSANPSFIVCTPYQLHLSLHDRELSVKNVHTLIFDEADFILTKQASLFEKIRAGYLKGIYQSLMISATLEPIKSPFFHSPVMIEDEKRPDLKEWYIGDKMSSLTNRYLITNHLILGNQGKKILIFCSAPRSAFSLMIMLSELKIPDVAVVSHYYPLLARYDLIDKFNKGDIRIMITDIKATEKVSHNWGKKLDPEGKMAKQFVKVESKVNMDEFNVARGIDFNLVDLVINFEMPDQYEDYVHRIGRTARGIHSGDAILLVSDRNSIWDRLVETRKLEEWKFDPEPVEKFRYRVESIENEIISQNVKTVIQKHIKQEISNAQKIKNHLSTRKLIAVNHLKSTERSGVPEYLLDDEKTPSKPKVQDEEKEGDDEIVRIVKLTKKHFDPLKHNRSGVKQVIEKKRINFAEAKERKIQETEDNRKKLKKERYDKKVKESLPKKEEKRPPREDKPKFVPDPRYFFKKGVVIPPIQSTSDPTPGDKRSRAEDSTSNKKKK